MGLLCSEIDFQSDCASPSASFQADSVDMDQVASEEKVTPRYLNCSTKCKIVSLTNTGAKELE